MVLLGLNFHLIVNITQSNNNPTNLIRNKTYYLKIDQNVKSEIIIFFGLSRFKVNSFLSKVGDQGYNKNLK